MNSRQIWFFKTCSGSTVQLFRGSKVEEPVCALAKFARFSKMAAEPCNFPETQLRPSVRPVAAHVPDFFSDFYLHKRARGVG
jgi:hypothetical protein